MVPRFGFAVLRLVLMVSLSGTWLVVHPETSHACSCLPLDPPPLALEEADAVFVGRVASLRHTESQDGWVSTADPVTVEFDVSTIWKGRNSKTLRLRTNRSEVSCGYEFIEGREYLVYAHSSRVSYCSRTRPLSTAAQDLAELGPGQTAGQVAPAPTPTVSVPERNGAGQDASTPTPPKSEAQASAVSELQTPAASESQTSSSGCGASPDTIDLAVVGLMVGAVWFGVGRRRSDAIAWQPRQRGD